MHALTILSMGVLALGATPADVESSIRAGNPPSEGRAVSSPSREGMASAKRAEGWRPEEVAELRGRCEASSVDQGLDSPRAHVLCRCAIRRLTELLSPSWLNNGKPITAHELQTVSGVYLRCARRIARPERVPENAFL